MAKGVSFFVAFSQLSRLTMVVLIHFKSWIVYLLLEYKWFLSSMEKMSMLAVVLLVERNIVWCCFGLWRLNNFNVFSFLLAIQAGVIFKFFCNKFIWYFVCKKFVMIVTVRHGCCTVVCFGIHGSIVGALFLKQQSVNKPWLFNFIYKRSWCFETLR